MGINQGALEVNYWSQLGNKLIDFRVFSLKQISLNRRKIGVTYCETHAGARWIYFFIGVIDLG